MDKRAYLKIDPAVRDKLKDHCKRHGLIMAVKAGQIISEYLKANK